jgi:hypothetical protein
MPTHQATSVASQMRRSCLCIDLVAAAARRKRCGTHGVGNCCIVLFTLLLLLGNVESRSWWGNKGEAERRGSNPSVYYSDASPTTDATAAAVDDTNIESDNHRSLYSERPRPPLQPPPPPGRQTMYNPIHYKFETTTSLKKYAQQRGRPLAAQAQFAAGDYDDSVPITGYDDDDKNNASPSPPLVDDGGGRAALPRYASPRTDAVTKYMATARGRATLFMSSGTAGACLGTVLGKSLWNRQQPVAITGLATAIAFMVVFFLRNPYGELVRALGLLLLWAVQRSHSVRRMYPTFRHVKASVGAAERRPFPPKTDNPWTYQIDDNDDDDKRAARIEFNMMYSLVAMAFVGSACASNLPWIPSWLGALGGAAALAYATTLRDARGDLARTMGMRVVALGSQVVACNRELQLLHKGAVVSGLILDKLFLLDRKHRIKDRIVAGVTFLYEQASRTATQLENQRQDRSNRREERGSVYRDDYRSRPLSPKSQPEGVRQPPPARREPEHRRPLRRDEDNGGRLSGPPFGEEVQRGPDRPTYKPR